MTCIAAIKGTKPGQIIMAGDRRISWGETYTYHESPVPKICKRNGLLIGGCGRSAVLEEVLTFCQFDSIRIDEDPKMYINNTFLPQMISHLTTVRMMKEGERRLSICDGASSRSRADDAAAALLVGVRGELFDVSLDSNFIEVTQVPLPFAMGSGGKYALGSLLTTENSRMSGRQRLTKALHVAAFANAACDTKIDLISG